MARTRLTNPQPQIALQYNPYQQSFLLARRLRVCPALCQDDEGQRFSWSANVHGNTCPKCQTLGTRPYRRFFLRAGRRGGKTRIGALSAIEEMLIPYSVGWACAPSFPELEDYVLPAFFSQLPSSWFDHPLTEWSEDRLSLMLPNKAQVHFRSLDDPNRGTGPGLDWLWIDEARKVQELAWDIIRPALTEKKGVAWLTSTPEWGEDWTHRRFYVPAEEARSGFWATTYRTVDNPIIDPAEVAEARETMPPDLFRREYEASIEYPTGTVFGDLIDACLADDARMKQWLPEWPRIDSSRESIAAIDPGTDHPFASSLIVATPFGLVFCNEYRERNKPFSIHAIELRKMAGGLQPRWGVDRSAKQAAIELAQHGIFASQAGLGGPGSVAASIQRLYAWMASGRLRISTSKCPQLIKELRAYRWAESKETVKGLGKDGVPYKKGDDLVDTARYGVMLWPELPVKGILDGVTPEGRDLSLLTAKAQRELKRNGPPPDDEDGLVRVTDDFTAHFMDDAPLGQSAMSDFYR